MYPWNSDFFLNPWKIDAQKYYWYHGFYASQNLPPQWLLCSILSHVDLFVFIIQKVYCNVGVERFVGLAEDFVSHGLRTV